MLVAVLVVVAAVFGVPVPVMQVVQVVVMLPGLVAAVLTVDVLVRLVLSVLAVRNAHLVLLVHAPRPLPERFPSTPGSAGGRRACLTGELPSLDSRR